MNRIVALSVLVAACVACGKKPANVGASRDAGSEATTTAATVWSPPKLSERFEQLVARLQSPDEHVRDGAVKELAAIERGLGDDKSIIGGESWALVYAAAKKFPARKAGESTQADLMRLAAHGDRVPMKSVSEVWGDLDDLAKIEALTLLANQNDDDSANEVLRLVREAFAKGSHLAFRFGTFATDSRQLLIFLPELLRYAKGDTAPPVLDLTARALRQEKIGSATVAPHAATITSAWRDLEKRDDLDRDRKARQAALDALEIMRSLPPELVDEPLRDAARSREPRVAIAGIIGLLHHRRAVRSADIEAAAAHPEVRRELFESLEGVRRADLYPARYRSTRAFAEADLAKWASEPENLGKVPAVIELVTLVTEVGRAEQERHDLRDDRTATWELYVLRYRADASAEWAGAFVGPIRRDILGKSDFGRLSSTVTKVEKLDELTADQLVTAAKQALRQALIMGFVALGLPEARE